MIGHDDVDPLPPGANHGLVSPNPTVHRDDEGHALLPGALQAAMGEVVSIPDPVRNEGDDVATQPGEPTGEQSGPRDPVHIVVAVDQDHFMIFDRPVDSPGGRSRAGEELR